MAEESQIPTFDYFQMLEGITERVFLFRIQLQNRRLLTFFPFLSRIFSSLLQICMSSHLPLLLYPLQNLQRDSPDLGVSFGFERRQILDRNSLHIEKPSSFRSPLRSPRNLREINRHENPCSRVLHQCLRSRWRCRELFGIKI